MIVLELTESKFGLAMKDISCIEEKLETVKSIFESEATGMSYRRKRYEDDDIEYRHHDRDYEREERERSLGYRGHSGGRYM